MLNYAKVGAISLFAYFALPAAASAAHFRSPLATLQKMPTQSCVTAPGATAPTCLYVDNSYCSPAPGAGLCSMHFGVDSPNPFACIWVRQSSASPANQKIFACFSEKSPGAGVHVATSGGAEANWIGPDSSTSFQLVDGKSIQPLQVSSAVQLPSTAAPLAQPQLTVLGLKAARLMSDRPFCLVGRDSKVCNTSDTQITFTSGSSKAVCATVREDYTQSPKVWACGTGGGGQPDWIQVYPVIFELYDASQNAGGSWTLAGAPLDTFVYRGIRKNIGANAVDLISKFTGIGCANPNGANPLTMAQVKSTGCYAAQRQIAQKVILDARRLGHSYLRTWLLAYGPRELAWILHNYKDYQAGVTELFQFAQANEMKLVPSFLWNIYQIPGYVNSGDTACTGASATVKEGLHDLLAHPDSQSMRCALKLTGDFTRLLAPFQATLSNPKGPLAFFEMGNEFNLPVDLDPTHAPSPMDCITSTDLVGFSQQFMNRVRPLAPFTSVSSGYAVPRTSAFHMELSAQTFNQAAPNVGDPSCLINPQGQYTNFWGPANIDTEAEYVENTARVNQAFDIASQHIYSDAMASPFGDGENMLAHFSNAALATGKIPYVGEFGIGMTPNPSADYENLLASTFSFVTPSDPKNLNAEIFAPVQLLAGALSALWRNPIPYASPWILEFYQFQPFWNTANEKNQWFDLDPGKPGFFQSYARQMLAINRVSASPNETIPSDSGPRCAISWPYQGSTGFGALNANQKIVNVLAVKIVNRFPRNLAVSYSFKDRTNPLVKFPAVPRQVGYGANGYQAAFPNALPGHQPKVGDQIEIKTRALDSSGQFCTSQVMVAY